MSSLTGCVCYICKKWHSHVFEYKRIKEDGIWKTKFICINCKHKEEIDGKGRI